ncbi:hypothetical protein ACIOBK_10180 [Micromonospora chokoriensis]
MYPRIRTISFDCHDTYTLTGFRPGVLAGCCLLRSAGERVATTVEDHQ